MKFIVILILHSLLFFSRWYNSLPPISKAYGTLCLAATIAVQIGVLAPGHIALAYEFVFYRFQVQIQLSVNVIIGTK